MSTRRVPLSSNPNAANSPFRGVTGNTTKAKRSYATIQREEAYGQPPPSKKQVLEVREGNLRTPPRRNVAESIEGHIFTRRSNAQPTAFEQKLQAARRRPTIQAVAKPDRAAEENLETIRQWQRHYRKVFPKFVFYFESVSDDVRLRYAKQVTALGACEEKFFSNAVTHVVTTRAIPPELSVSPVEQPQESSMADTLGQGSQPQTINPLLLERSSELAATHSESYPPKGRFTFESVARKGSGAEYESRKQPGRSSDVLQKARELGMKIWALEKLQRMMNTMFETDTSMAYSHGHNTRSNSVQAGTVSRSTREADLSALLRHERINGPSDRDPTVATRELTLFKGPFIYVHDINEKQKPIMVREYAKVSNKEHGDWPQFRSVPHGKCPFVPEADYSKRDAERDVARQQRQLERERAVAAPRTRAAAAVQTRTQQGRADGQQGLTESASAGNRGAPAAVVKELDLFGRPVEQAADDSHFTKGPQNAFVSRAVGGRLLGGEPVASGLQHSNITSAIRSQMISSTAAAPGAKAGTSKEVHGLQRKVFEKNSGPTSLGLTSSHRMTDLNLIKDDASTKTLKRRNMETIDDEPQEAENVSRRHDEHKPTKAVSRKRASKREPKAGYCENCFDKFDDFEEHIMSRNHRRFAEKAENWKELDKLLEQLERPLKLRDDEYY